MTNQEKVLRMLQSGLAVVPSSIDIKKPKIEWKEYCTRLPSESEVKDWFPQNYIGNCGIITGLSSGNLECIDFDERAVKFKKWKRNIPNKLLKALVVESTMSDGIHVIYRTDGEIETSRKLCKGMRYCHERKTMVQKTLIETRGIGGFFACDFSLGYKLFQNDWHSIPKITKEDRDFLISEAELITEIPIQHRKIEKPKKENKELIDNNSLRPGDDFNERGDVEKILTNHGWSLLKENGDDVEYGRPGKEWNKAAVYHRDSKKFHVFSNNSFPFEGGVTYSPFNVYSILEHDGDMSKAASDLAKLGFGNNVIIDVGSIELDLHNF